MAHDTSLMASVNYGLQDTPTLPNSRQRPRRDNPIGDRPAAGYTGRVMNAKPLLTEVGRALQQVGLDAVLIGNAAAALQGAPVTTVDLDFLFRNTPRNVARLKRFAAALHAMVLRPYYPASDLFRVVRDEDGLQVDFMATIHGVRSFEGVRARATTIAIDDVPVRVASLADIVKSKRAAGRPRDLAILDILEKALEEAGKPARETRRAQERE